MCHGQVSWILILVEMVIWMGYDLGFKGLIYIYIHTYTYTYTYTYNQHLPVVG